ncbi:hypothetical protein FRC04_011107 [Tulasnella sp. 424]|nr:hypothetical protein FRC04_011107 [Tulasnella sp. 424]KAG8978422.1 hypothetical protein FRC05_010667 [Tulasnella sp. 425]
MASVKLGALVIRTLAKPISNQIKQQSQEHPRFRQICVNLAQWSYRSEYRLRVSLLGEAPKAIKPLSEARAIQNGANMLAEGFLFAVAATLVLAETWRSSRSTSKRRDAIDENIEELQTKVAELEQKLADSKKAAEEQWEELRTREEEVTRILDRIVYIGLRGGWDSLHQDALRTALEAMGESASPELSPSTTASSLPSEKTEP